MENEENNATCCWFDNAGSDQRLQLAKVRRSDLPQLEQDGKLSPLVIPEDSGLVEAIHIVFFPDNLIGCEYNFYGPRISRLGYYLAEKANDVCPKMSIKPLLRQDVRQQLARLQDVRLMKMKIHPSFVDIVTDADRDLGSAFKAALTAGQAEEVEIVIKPKRTTQVSVGQRFISFANKLLSHGDFHGGVDRFAIKGMNEETHKVDEVDILSDELIVKKRIMKIDSRTRALASESAYDAIQEAYEELRTDLLAAAMAQT